MVYKSIMKKLTKFGRRVVSPAALFMVVIAKDYVKNEVVLGLYKRWWHYPGALSAMRR